MGAFVVTDINDGTLYPVNSNHVNAVYELDIYRILRLKNGVEYDVAETFEALNTDIGGQPITGP